MLGSLFDRSGTITSGGTAQTAAPAMSGRRYLLVQNVSDTTMWVDFGTAAVANQPSIQLVAGASLELGGHTGVCPDEYISVIGATTAKAYVIKEA